MSIEDRVKKIVSDQLGKSVDEIQSDSSFVDDLDHLQMMNHSEFHQQIFQADH